jgi:predicted pyridoxine 5'-phosphate oxidase superfamily flavin-nucleotide-binding protein
MNDQPYHDGELAVQRLAGERDMARRLGGAFSPRIVPGALPFLARQRLLAVATTTDEGHLWTSVWSGAPGFVQSADGQRVTISRSSTAPAPGDPVRPGLTAGRQVGLLAIDFALRRRLRINGTIETVTAEEIQVLVRESIPNCPKYIQRRQPTDDPAMSPPATSAPERGRVIGVDERAFVERADTAFVGSLHAERGVDASHRGGAPGFIQVVDATSLRVPDYAGNSMFLTLGNFAADPRASLAVLDFERGHVLSFSGEARLDFDRERPDLPTGGTGRYWELTVREWVRFELPWRLRWGLIDASPYNPPPPTGRP